MDSKDLFWLAGLLEGEGSFLKPPPSDPKRPRIKIAMTDEDVIERVNVLFGVQYYYTRPVRRKIHWKTEYSTVLRGRRAFELMHQLYPLMGSRRKSQIETATNIKPLCQTVQSKEFSLFWLAGLLEGEGSFLPGPPSAPNKLRIQIVMTDKDVLDKAAELMDSKVKGPYSRTRVTRASKPYFAIVSKGKCGFNLMTRLLPLMGNRRKQHILNALATYTPDSEFGDNHPQAKLTAAKVRDIKLRIAGGVTLHSLALEYQVDVSLIWQIKAGRIWRHVE